MAHRRNSEMAMNWKTKGTDRRKKTLDKSSKKNSANFFQTIATSIRWEDCKSSWHFRYPEFRLSTYCRQCSHNFIAFTQYYSNTPVNQLPQLDTHSPCSDILDFGARLIALATALHFIDCSVAKKHDFIQFITSKLCTNQFRSMTKGLTFEDKDKVKDL